MSNSTHICKPLCGEGKPRKITLENIYDDIESLGKWREEWEIQLKEELSTILTEHKIKLSTMLENNYK